MITGNEPAMPFVETTQGQECSKDVWFDLQVRTFHGLTIRQHFAAMAMQGILSNPEFLAHHKDIDIHSIAVENADSLIAELNKEQ